MAKQAAHDSSDECSNHSGLMLIIYKKILLSIKYKYIYKYPSAGIGRQDNLKIYWYNIVNVQVVFRIIFFLLYINIFICKTHKVKYFKGI